MDELVNNLAVKFQEDVYLDFTEEELLVARKDFEGSVMVKLVGDRGFKKGIFSSMFKKLWGTKGSVTFAEVEDNILMAKFSSPDDKERVLSSGPWLHMGWAVLVARWIPGTPLEALFSDSIQIMMQVHNLPLEMRTEQTARRCASTAGKVIESFPAKSSISSGFYRRKFFRFKIEINIKKALVPGCFLGRKEDNPPQANFRFEKLPNVCFKCGLFDHETMKCSNEERVSKIKYTKYIRADYLDDEEGSEEDAANHPLQIDKITRISSEPDVEGEESLVLIPKDKDPVTTNAGKVGRPLTLGNENHIKNASVGDIIFQDDADSQASNRIYFKEKQKERETIFSIVIPCQPLNPFAALPNGPSALQPNIGLVIHSSNSGPNRKKGPDRVKVRSTKLKKRKKRKSTKKIGGIYKMKKQCSATRERTATVSLRGNSKRVEWRSEQVKVRNEPTPESPTLGSSM